MRCYSFAICVLLCLPHAGSSLPMAPPPKAITLYFPIKPGAKWTYECGGKTIVEIATSVTESDNVRFVTVATQEGKVLVPKEKIAVSKTGLARVAAGGNELGYRLHLLAVPLKIGQKWEFGATTITVAGVEEVEVPAGKFETVRVVKISRIGGVDLHQVYWFAPDIGAVKRLRRIGKNGPEVVEALKAFTLEKD